ncbi:hypothetical protein LV779_38080 [Streptomyces thinghirensis]|nr:hypothetical protein [Streptomyces thinghirensis]
MLAARPTDARDEGGDPALLGASGSAAVRRSGQGHPAGTREGRRRAEAQRSKALEYEKRLDRQRQKIDAMHEDLGRIARAQ